MSPALTDQDFAALIAESDDTFKLAIRGHSALEAELEAAMDDAFPHGLPPELRSGTFVLKLAMAIALGLVIPEYEAPFRALNKLRNDFAHGRLTELTSNRSRSLLDTSQPLLLRHNEEPPGLATLTLRDLAPIATLRYVLMAARAAVLVSSDVTRQHREEAERLVTLHRALDARRDALMRESGHDDPPAEVGTEEDPST